jgi:hypothetical protein
MSLLKSNTEPKGAKFGCLGKLENKEEPLAVSMKSSGFSGVFRKSLLWNPRPAACPTSCGKFHMNTAVLLQIFGIH